MEAAWLVGQEPWDSRAARLFEGENVSVLVAPRRGRSAAASNVWVTMIVRSGAVDEHGAVKVTLANARKAHEGQLDQRGCCVIRDVPDGAYWISVWRTRDRDDAERGATLSAGAVDRLDVGWPGAYSPLTASRARNA
jgi:hypothetical protein